ncbi:MAG: PepSY domain-containing protein [Thauera sp.]|jgi:hypothetical protein
MRATTLITTLVLSGGIFAAGAALVPAIAQTAPAATQAVPAGSPSQASWMTMQQIQTKLEAAGYRDFEKIERERNKYEVKATDAQGQRVELDVDPVNGDILETEVKRNK